MDTLGKVSEWNDARGFGFIQPQAGGPRVFFHIRDYQRQGRRPELGEWVRYVAGTGRDGKPAATRLRRVVPPSTSAQAARRAQHEQTSGWNGGLAGWLVLLGYLAGLAWGLRSGFVQDWAAIGIALLSGVTWLAYAMDKRAAGRQAQRTPEATLHLLELLGGWPGALIAQRSLRHKNRKRRYQMVFWSIVLLHCAALLVWIWKTASP